MSQEIRIPDIGDVEDVEVVEILVSSGDQVSEDDPIIVIESDKASMEVPAGIGGTIDSIDVSVGDKVAEGDVIARLKEAADDKADDDKAADDQAAEAEPSAAQAPAPDGEPEREPSGDAGGETVEIRVPDIGDAENVEVIEVAVRPGDRVEEGDSLVVVESDKASMEVPSSHAGTVKEVHVSEGTQVEEGTKLVTLETGARTKGKGDERAAGKAEGEAPARPEPEKAAPRSREAAGAGEPAAEDDRDAAARDAAPRDDGRETAPPSSGTDVYAGPAVRRLARELGVNLREVQGSGNRGRIVKDDVKSHVKRRMTSEAPAGGALPGLPRVDFSKFGDVEEQPLSRTRASGAQNLHRSWVNIPHVTQHDEVDVTDLEDFRASLKAEGERRGVKVTPLAFIIKACCQVLKEFPTFNASLDPSAKTFILKRYYHIGLAVDTPEGLVVPVIRDADRKGVWELSAEVAELADKARNKKLGMTDMQGGSFSVSSLGPIGGTGFTPIINAPEVAILGVSRVTVRPVWRNETFVPRKMLPLSLSYDHRAINGAEAGRFVARLGEILSDIRRLAL